MVSTESSEKTIAQHRLLVPRLSLMMFLQFFIWGSWSVTLGLVMTQHNMSLLIGDAFSMGLSPPFSRRSCSACWWTASSPRRR